MSITISNCDEICHSPTNQSKSKMLYTFSKENRFSKRRVILCDKYYDCKGLDSSRTTGFGYGTKYDFTKDTPKSPPPTSYSLRSDFDKDEKKGFGFGFGRHQMEITGPFVQSRKEKAPGPGAYQLKSTLNDTSTFSLRGKDYSQDHQKLKLPGPGSYPITFPINQKGQYFLSKYKNSCIRSFNTLSDRGKMLQNKVPGPGAYPIDKASLSPQGKYVLSRMMSSQTRRFGTSNRAELGRKTDTPGPGNYKLPSQFGHYIAKNAIKKPQTQQVGRKPINVESKQNQKPQ